MLGSITGFGQTGIALEPALHPLAFFHHERPAYAASVTLVFDDILGFEYRHSFQAYPIPLVGGRQSVAFDEFFLNAQFYLDAKTARERDLPYRQLLLIEYGQATELVQYAAGNFRRDCRTFDFAAYEHASEVTSLQLKYAYRRALAPRWFVEFQGGLGAQRRETISTYNPIIRPTGSFTLNLFCRNQEDRRRFSGTFFEPLGTISLRVGYRLVGRPQFAAPSAVD